MLTFDRDRGMSQLLGGTGLNMGEIGKKGKICVFRPPWQGEVDNFPIVLSLSILLKE